MTAGGDSRCNNGGGRGGRGGGRIIIAGGDDPPSLVPEVTDMVRRHALARA